MEYGFGCIVISSPYTSYSTYLRGTVDASWVFVLGCFVDVRAGVYGLGFRVPDAVHSYFAKG